MTRYLELARIARTLKAETWRRGARPTARHEGKPRGGETSNSGPRVSAAGLALATTTAGPP